LMYPRLLEIRRGTKVTRNPTRVRGRNPWKMI
jgi:hypothetical protein